MDLTKEEQENNQKKEMMELQINQFIEAEKKKGKTKRNIKRSVLRKFKMYINFK